MELSIHTITLFLAVSHTGLSSGLFYAWSVSVIPGTRKVLDSAYLETMQSINRAILNPAFFLIFFGSLILLCVTTVLLVESKQSFWLLLIAAIIYAVGSIGITAMGNVPLNNQLDKLSLQEISSDEISAFRKHYEVKWNRLHTIRTVFAVLAFLLSILAVIAY
jgi:uncharacterized membrane protein